MKRKFTISFGKWVCIAQFSNERKGPNSFSCTKWVWGWGDILIVCYYTDISLGYDDYMWRWNTKTEEIRVVQFWWVWSTRIGVVLYAIITGSKDMERREGINMAVSADVSSIFKGKTVGFFMSCDLMFSVMWPIVWSTCCSGRWDHRTY